MFSPSIEIKDEIEGENFLGIRHAGKRVVTAIRGIDIVKRRCEKEKEEWKKEGRSEKEKSVSCSPVKREC